MFISDGNTKLLVDAGVSAAKITNALCEIGVSPAELDAILVTHEHSDHIAGIAVLTRKFGIPVYANEKTHSKIAVGSSKISSEFVRSFITGEKFKIGSAEIRSFKTPHDSVESVGYTVVMEDKKIAVATDTGCITKPMLGALAGCDAVLIESNHDVGMLTKGDYPYILKNRILSDNGHLSNENCAWLATQLAIWGTTHITLGHLSDNNNTYEKAYSATEKMLLDNNFKVGEDVILQVASKSEITEII